MSPKMLYPQNMQIASPEFSATIVERRLSYRFTFRITNATIAVHTTHGSSSSSIAKLMILRAFLLLLDLWCHLCAGRGHLRRRREALPFAPLPPLLLRRCWCVLICTSLLACRRRALCDCNSCLPTIPLAHQPAVVGLRTLLLGFPFLLLPLYWSTTNPS